MKVLLVAAVISGLGVANADSGSDAPASCEAPTGLSCELLLEPSRTVIYDPRPEFGWECGAGSEAYRQSGYQILVREHSEMDQPLGQVVWDSGRIDSSESLNVEYAGEPLRPGNTYMWQVRAWNDASGPSAWSKPQVFHTAPQLSEAETSRYGVVEIPQPAVSIRNIGEQTYFVDFGTAAFGYLKLRLEPASERRELRVRFGEKLLGERIDPDPGGTIRTYTVDVNVPAGASNLVIRPPRDKRNTTGQAIRLPRSVGVVAPFRYVELEGLPLPPNAADIVQIRIEYPFDDSAATFVSSDATLNAIWEMCKYSIRATTFCGVYVDGDRERIPYEADAYLNQLSHYGVDREYALARHSHEYLLDNPTWPTEWKQHSVLMAWADYLYTGDAESLERNYEVLKRRKLLSRAERPDGLLDTSERFRDIVDWPEGERDGYEMLPVNTVVNAFHYATLKRMADLATALGRDDDAEKFADKAAALKQTFNRVFWNDTRQRYVDGEGSLHSSLHANLFPLAFGLVPEERLAAVVDFVKSRRMRCSVYAAQYLLEGLYQAGEDQYALDLLTSRGKRSWYNMIRSGSTIALEAWDQDFKPNLDWNHAWGAAPANLIPSYLVGVRPLEPGFKKIVVQPRPGDLDTFTAKVPSPRGAIHVRYSRNDEQTELEVEVPGNALAKVGIPLREPTQLASILWNGAKATAGIAGSHAWIDNVPPGKHSFKLTATPAVVQVSKSAPPGR